MITKAVVVVQIHHVDRAGLDAAVIADLRSAVYARVIRIGAVMTRLDKEGLHDWALLAADFGYHDQAHLAHDFQEFCGASPGDYLRRSAAGGGATIEEPRS